MVSTIDGGHHRGVKDGVASLPVLERRGEVADRGPGGGTGDFGFCGGAALQRQCQFGVQMASGPALSAAGGRGRTVPASGSSTRSTRTGC